MSEQPAPYGTGAGPAPSTSAPTGRIRTHHLREMKERGERFSMLTAYDMYTAATFDEAGIEVLLVGDSASNNVYGNETSLPVTVDELLPLTRAVSRSVRRAMVVGDLPFGSYQASPEQGYLTAVRFMKEAGAHCVKLEGGAEMAPVIAKCVAGGIPVMAHIGFTPQSEHTLGGYRVQGRGDAADRVLRDAHAVQEAGAFAVVMEMVPGDVATQVTKELADPHDRHRRGQRLRRPGAGLAGRLRAAHGPDGPLRQAVRRRPHGAPRRRQGLLRRRKGGHLPRSRAHLLSHPGGVLSLHAPPPRIDPPRRLRPGLHRSRRSRHRPGARGRHPRHEHLVGPGARGRAPPAAKVTPRLEVTRVVTGLDIPWDVQQLPGGALLVTERDRARLSLVTGGGTPLAALPEQHRVGLG